MIFSDYTYEMLLFISQVILPTLAFACTALGKVVDSQWLTLAGGIVAAADAILGQFLLKCREFYHSLENYDGTMDEPDEEDN